MHKTILKHTNLHNNTIKVSGTGFIMFEVFNPLHPLAYRTQLQIY